MELSKQKTLALIKPDAVKAGKAEEMIQLIEGNGFEILAKRRLQLTKEQAEEFYAEHKGKTFYDTLVEFMTSGPIVALVLSKEEAMLAWRNLMGPTNVFRAREVQPDSLRAKFGTNGTMNACHGSDSPASAAREITFFFPDVPPVDPLAVVPEDLLYVEKTFAIIKPDAVAAGRAEEMMQIIRMAGFAIVAKKKLQLSKEQASAFYAEHQGKPFYETLVGFMTSGPVFVLVLAKPGAIKEWRATMGPTNTFKAREEAPSSLRALFGTDGTRNACHGSDSPASVVREVGFFFPEVVVDPGLGAFEASLEVPSLSDVERTLALIKPDAVAAGKAHEMMQLIERAGFNIVAQQKMLLTRARAQEFYAEHEGKPFFNTLVDFMTSGPIYALILARHNAIKAWRALMGPTNVFKAREEAPRCLRALYGSDGTRNACHGSDSPASATRELKFYFPATVLEPLPETAQARSYIEKHLEPTLVKALTALAQEKPTAERFEAITFLANWLLSHNPNRPRIVTPDQWQGADVEDDEAEFAEYNGRPVQSTEPGAEQTLEEGVAQSSAVEGSPSGEPSTTSPPRQHQEMTMELAGVPEEEMDHAATMVQAVWRGHQARKEVDAMRGEVTAE